MIFQHRNDGKVIAYTGNPSSDYREAIVKLGMAEADGSPKQYVTVEHGSYMVSPKANLSGVHFAGHAVECIVLPDAYPFTFTPESLARASAMLPRGSVYRFGRYTFTTPFTASGKYSVSDSEGRSITMNEKAIKDIGAIHNLMANIGFDNGRIFEPVIARYVNAAAHMPKGRPLVGYFDLEAYIDAVNGDMASIFRMSSTKAAIFMWAQRGASCALHITGVKDGQVEFEFTGIKEIFDRHAMGKFHPYVIVSQTPLSISDMKFPSTRVNYKGAAIFVTPMMTEPGAWNSLVGGVDLLSPIKSGRKTI